MSTLFSYIKKYKDVPFDKENLTIVDALILTGISYLPLPSAPSNTMSSHDTLANLLQVFIDHPSAYKQCVMPLTDLKFARTLVKTNRYKDIILYGYKESISVVEQKQFRAVTFVRDDKSQIFISFCGTDTTLVGWKEDFNISIKDELPSQRTAINYIEEIAKKFPNAEIYIGGHSKGGNIAMYAATYCNPKDQKRIKYVFNFDGPGLLDEDLNSDEYQNIRDKIITILPTYSLVGILFGFSDDYRIIRSFGIGIYAHSFYYWNTKDKDFLYSKRISRLSIKTRLMVEKANRDLTKHEKQLFLDTMYKLLTSGGATTTRQITHNLLKAFEGGNEIFAQLDEDLKNLIDDVLSGMILGYLRPLNAEECKIRKMIEEHATKK